MRSWQSNLGLSPASTFPLWGRWQLGQFPEDDDVADSERGTTKMICRHIPPLLVWEECG